MKYGTGRGYTPFMSLKRVNFSVVLEFSGIIPGVPCRAYGTCNLMDSRSVLSLTLLLRR